MVQAGSYVPLEHQQNTVSQQQSLTNSAYVVIDQPPCRREVFPYRLPLNWILGFSIAKCILGLLLFIFGIVNVAAFEYRMKIAFPIWCGLTILANGIIGCILKCQQTKCVIGAFLGLSITSLIFSITMLSFYSVVLDYFLNTNRYYCNYPAYGGSNCIKIMSGDVTDAGIGITSFVISLVMFELACSIGSVVLSCKAYFKFCNTCNVNDCCTCLGCGECDCIPLNAQQGAQAAATAYYGHQNMQMSPFQQPHYQPNQQHAQSNPCSGFVNYIISVPSYVFGAVYGAQQSAFNVTVQPVPSSQQVPLIEQGRSVEQVQGAGSVAIGDNQPNQAPAIG